MSKRGAKKAMSSSQWRRTIKLNKVPIFHCGIVLEIVGRKGGNDDQRRISDCPLEQWVYLGA